MMLLRRAAERAYAPGEVGFLAARHHFQLLAAPEKMGAASAGGGVSGDGYGGGSGGGVESPATSDGSDPHAAESDRRGWDVPMQAAAVQHGPVANAAGAASEVG